MPVDPAVQALLVAARASYARDERLDLDRVAREGGVDADAIRWAFDFAVTRGLLAAAPSDEPESPPLVLVAGDQYLSVNRRWSDETLTFLPHYVDDLFARAALISACDLVIDEFRHALLAGNAVDHARGIVPRAFATAVDEALAVDLFAASVACVARLGESTAAACVAEEIVAVEIISLAADVLDRELDQGTLDPEGMAQAREELRGVFELFGDDDVLQLFDMEEPGDAAVAGHKDINREMGVVDQRIEAWFDAFGGVTPIGHLRSRTVG